MSQPQQLTIEQAISQAKKAAKKGNVAGALQLYNAVLQHQPNHPVARKAVRKLQKQLPHDQFVAEQAANPSQDQINALINLFQSGQMSRAEQTCRKLLRTHPQSLIVINVLGISLQALGRLEDAVQAFDRAIQLKPDFAEAYSNRGVALQELGQLNEAVESCNKAIQLQPQNAVPYNNRGVALKELGQLNEAVESCNKAIQLKPDYAEAYNIRGAALKELGQLKAAVVGYDKAIQLKPDYAEAYSNRGAALKELGQLEQAVVSCDRAIQLKPDNAIAYNNRGVALNELGQQKQAVESYDKAIQLQPDYAEAYSNRGAALQELGQHEEAVESYDKAIQLKPDYAKAHYNRGSLRQNIGQLKEAMESYDKAIQLKSDYAEAYNNRGAVLQELGQLDGAVESYDKAIQLKPDYAEAQFDRSTLRKYEPDDPQIELMEKLITDSNPGEKDRIFLCFALAKAYESSGEYDKSFNYLEQGNRLRYKELNYDIGDIKTLITKTREIISAGILPPGVTPEGNTSIRPLFIVGMPRSGTTLVEQILASHSQVYGAGELEIMRKLVYPILSSLPDQNLAQNSSEISRNEINTVRDGYLDALAALNVPEKIITDKMPLNFLYIGFILSAFPEAKIIHLNRDPMATCWSIYKHHFAGKGNGYGYNMEVLAEFYKLYIDLMSFWRESFAESIYDLGYEYLTENQEDETRKLLRFCDLEWEEQCLDFHNTKRAVKTASNVQVRTKMYKGSSGVWRKYERHLQPLINELGYRD